MLSNQPFVPHGSHWGSFSARDDRGRIEIVPSPIDPDPSPLLQAYAEAVHHPTRIGQPHIREGWLARRGESRGERGGEKFVPVPWDEALALVAAELDTTRSEYGNEAIFGGSYGWSSAGRFHHARSQLHRFLNSVGGFTDQTQNYSYAAAITFLPHVIGSIEAVQGPVSSLDGIAEHTRLMLCFGGISPGNMQVEAGGHGMHTGYEWLRRCARAGMRLVNISPVSHELPEGIEAEWIPIRPGTDTAVMLAMAYVLLSEGRHDTGFLNTHCVGAPEIERYLDGRADGVTKGPRWAEAISGVPASTIAELARGLVSTRSFITGSWSLQRADRGEQPLWAIIALAAFVGQIGMLGGGFAFGLWSINGMGNARRPISSPRLPVGTNPTRSFIPVARVSDMLLDPGGSYRFNGTERIFPRIEVIYWCGGNPFHHHQDINRLVSAFKRPRTVVVQDIWWTATARHADIVLPATTTFERNDIGGSARDRFLIAMKQTTAPVGQSRDDFEIFRELSQRMDAGEAFDEGRSEMGWLRHIYGEVRNNAGKAGIDISDFDAFWEKGSAEIPPPEKPFTLFEAFRRDPEAAALATPSGKIELFSERIAGFGLDDIGGHAEWVPPAEWLGAAQPGELHLISLQPRTRLHSQLDIGSVSVASKIGGREPIWMNPTDVARRGLRDGDVVRVHNRRGEVLAGVLATDRVMPGVAILATGAWYDPERPGMAGTLDKHGNSNVLTFDRGSSQLTQAPSPQSCLVRVERFDRVAPDLSVLDTPSLASARTHEGDQP
jgi:biotin/methionine sulfoxide reductase